MGIQEMQDYARRTQEQELRKWAVERAQSHGPRDGAGRGDPTKVVAYAKELEAYVLGEVGPEGKPRGTVVA